MEEFTFQINVMAISLASIALVAIIFILVFVFLLLSFYFRFANKLDKVLSDINTISEKGNVLVSLVSDEVSKAKDKMDSVYYTMNTISNKLLSVSNFIQDFRVPKFIKALFSLFSKKNYNSLDTRTIKTKRKFDNTVNDDFDF